MLGKLQVTTPDEHTNRMVNIWNGYQVMATFNISRSASMFESGVGAAWASATPTRICWLLC